MKTRPENYSHLIQSLPFAGLLAALTALLLVWLITAEAKVSLFASIIGLILVTLYFSINLERAYLLLSLVLILPLGLFITAIPNLKAAELAVPGLFALFLVRTLVSKSRGPGPRILPLAVIVFFALGLVSYLRHPSLPTQLFARSVDLGNFRRYWSFFLGLPTYILAFHLFRSGRRRKFAVLLRFATFLYVFAILFHLAITGLRIKVPEEFFMVGWGPVAEGQATGGIVFRGWAFGWYGLNLLLILMCFPGYPKNRWIKWPLLLLALVSIILSGARATLLAAAASAVLICLLQGRLIRLMAPLAAVTAILIVSYSFPQAIDSLPPACRRIFTIFPSSDFHGHREAVISVRTRFLWWREAMDTVALHPLGGIGFEKVGRRALYLSYQDYAVQIGDSHNAYIATAVMLGIPGALAVAWIILLHLARSVILYREGEPSFEKDFNLWLATILFSYTVVFFFAGSPQELYHYLLYAGLVNLNWRARGGGQPPETRAAAPAAPPAPANP